ncbi:hypothetical protein T440DRAFT_80782 [Plenodomus tracheiphilus IPT5]|uniref:Uncharacterized protein n=1 Tax=Plenodomus tracheiphilus IPT5 TaxID=1408161 RepID=A0A6A7B5Q9_9PLEO|nr:hypothetical protein T440DRAFT_80782 [Plenodomus tracheiphilus IPT5]
MHITMDAQVSRCPGVQPWRATPMSTGTLPVCKYTGHCRLYCTGQCLTFASIMASP